MAAPPVPLLLITGPVGAGKTSVAGEIATILERAQVPHAFVDIDSLRWCYPHPPDDPFNERLAMRNLAAVWTNFVAMGIDRIVLAAVLESRADLERYRAAIPGADILVVRLRAELATLRERLHGRELGAGLEWHLARAAELATQMEEDAVEDLAVDTDGKTVDAIAREILERAGWPGED